MKKWWDVAYVEGYIDGHLFTVLTDKERKYFPRYYDLGLNEKYRNIKEYQKSLLIAKGRKKSISKYALDYVEKNVPDKSIILQHTPFLL